MCGSDGACACGWLCLFERKDLRGARAKSLALLSFVDLSLLVVDEADRLMDQQHSDDLKKLLAYFREKKKEDLQQLQFAETKPDKIPVSVSQEDTTDDEEHTKRKKKKKNKEGRLVKPLDPSSSVREAFQSIQVALFSATLTGTMEEQQRSKALWGILKNPLCIRVSNALSSSSSSAEPPSFLLGSSASSPLEKEEQREQEEDKQGEEEAGGQVSSSSPSSASVYPRHSIPSTLQNFFAICEYEEKLPFLVKFIQ